MAKGTLYIVGGGLNKSERRVFTQFIKSAGGENARVAFVLSASGRDPDETYRSYRDVFVSLGVKKENCQLLPVYGPEVVDERGENLLNGDAPGLVERMEGVTAVWFTGGDQYYTSKCMLRPDGTDTALLAEIRRIYNNGGVLGGSSAGAAIMSRVMIGEGSNRGLLANGVTIGYEGYNPDAEDESPDSGCPLLMTYEGLGFLDGAVVDQHFNRRPRLLRLIESCLINSLGHQYGFGISEDTALVASNGECRVMGSGGVFYVDCSNAERESAGNVKNVKLCALFEGDVLNGDGTVTIAREAPKGERYFQTDYLSGAITDSPLFDDAMDKLLRGDDTSVWFENDTRYVKGAVVYGAEKRTFVVTLKYALGADGFGAYDPATGHTSIANVMLDVSSREVRL